MVTQICGASHSSLQVAFPGGLLPSLLLALSLFSLPHLLPAQTYSNANTTTFSISDGPHIAFIDSNQHVSQIWYTSIWNYSDLTIASTANPAATTSALSNFLLSDGVHLVYADVSNHLGQIWYGYATNKWSFSDLTKASGSSALPRTSLGNFLLSDGPHIVYIDGQLHVRQVWYTSATNQWSAQDLSALSGAPPAYAGTALSTFNFSDGPHFLYTTQAGHLDQVLYPTSSGNWTYQDLTQLTASPLVCRKRSHDAIPV